jgi:hypothetical protein
VHDLLEEDADIMDIFQDRFRAMFYMKPAIREKKNTSQAEQGHDRIFHVDSFSSAHAPPAEMMADQKPPREEFGNEISQIHIDKPW